jgi:hypothetical protein
MVVLVSHHSSVSALQMMVLYLALCRRNSG